MLELSGAGWALAVIAAIAVGLSLHYVQSVARGGDEDKC